MYYLDNAATTQVLKEAASVAYDGMVKYYGNPSSLHLMGKTAEDKMENSREIISQILKCKPKELYFTSCATQSNNLGLFGASTLRKKRGNKIVTSRIEHPSVNNTMNELEKRGFEVVKVDPKNSKYNANDFIDEIDENTILLSVMYVNNEVGMVMPIEEISKRAKEKNPNIIVHVDGVQAFCKYAFSIQKLDVDILSISAHKIHGPKGIGAIYIKQGLNLPKIMYGGGQENQYSPGTESIPLICAFAKAAQKMDKIRDNAFAHVKQINEKLRDEFKNMEEIDINSNEDSSPYILNFSIRNIPSEVMLHYLEDKGIYVSSGSACSKGENSGIIPILGYTRQREDTSIRASFSYDTPIEAVDSLAINLKEGIKNIVT